MRCERGAATQVHTAMRAVLSSAVVAVPQRPAGRPSPVRLHAHSCCRRPLICLAHGQRQSDLRSSQSHEPVQVLLPPPQQYELHQGKGCEFDACHRHRQLKRGRNLASYICCSRPLRTCYRLANSTRGWCHSHIKPLVLAAAPESCAAQGGAESLEHTHPAAWCLDACCSCPGVHKLPGAVR